MSVESKKTFQIKRPPVSKGWHFEWALWIGVCTSAIGGSAWCAGEAYVSGYWNAVGLQPEIVGRSAQELAFFGFVGSFVNWLYMCAFLALLGGYGLFMEFVSTLRLVRVEEKRPNRFFAWLRKTFPNVRRSGRMDRTFTLVFGSILILSVGLGAVVVLPLGLWVVGAEAEGHDLMVKQVCRTRRDKILPTTVILEDGTKLHGKLLARNEKIGVLLDTRSIYQIQYGEKTVLQDTTDVQMLACTN